MKPSQSQYRSRQGQSIQPDDLRRHCVSARLSKSELADLDARRSGTGMQRGEYLRQVALSRIPTPIPSINREALIELGRIGNNLNQLTRAANTIGIADLDDLRESAKALRNLYISESKS